MRPAIPARISVLLAALLATPVLAQIDRATDSTSPGDLLRGFRAGWDESLWQQKFRGKAGYMRRGDDRGWRLRMTTLQQLVGHGQQAVPTLVRTLKSGSTPERILAAQALGNLGQKISAEPLLEAAKSDADPAVRLYAVDALGMTGRDASTIDWKSLREAETNRDARRHIDYAAERAGKKLDASVVRELIEWDAKLINSAALGKPAPDFTLTAATGETVRLSDFRGKKAVVLVFIYGDT